MYMLNDVLHFVCIIQEIATFIEYIVETTQDNKPYRDLGVA